MTLRVGIISAAWGGFAHLPAWRSIPGVEVAAICTSRRETAEAAASRLKIARPFWNAEEMCADPDIDIVDVGTRPVLRRPWVITALRNGKHVYNAVPHAADWEGAKAIDAAWRASNSVGVVDAYSEWLPAHRLMKRYIEDGKLGQPFGGTCHFNLSLFNTPNKQFPYNWFAHGGQGVSAVRNNGSHALHALIFLFGPIAEVVADDRQLLDTWEFPDGDVIKPETNDFASALLRFENGMTIQLRASWSMSVADGWLIDVFGSKGRLVAQSPSFPTVRDCTLKYGAVGGALEPVEIAREMATPPGGSLGWDFELQPSVGMALSMHNMLQAIRGEAKAAPDFAQAFEVERVQEAIRRSSTERRWVRIAEVV